MLDGFEGGFFMELFEKGGCGDVDCVKNGFVHIDVHPDADDGGRIFNFGHNACHFFVGEEDIVWPLEGGGEGQFFKDFDGGVA